MGKKILGLLFFGILFVFAVFTYIPYSNDVSVTSNPYGVINTYSVSGNWSDRGTLDTNMLTDGDLIYADQKTSANFTSFVQAESKSRTVELRVLSNPVDGEINAYVNAWESMPNGSAPDQTFKVNVTDEDFTTSFRAKQYDYFNVVIEITETGNSANMRPSVDSFTLEWIDESEQFGFKAEDFQVFTLFVMLGCGLIALTRWVNE